MIFGGIRDTQTIEVEGLKRNIPPQAALLSKAHADGPSTSLCNKDKDG